MDPPEPQGIWIAPGRKRDGTRVPSPSGAPQADAVPLRTTRLRGTEWPPAGSVASPTRGPGHPRNGPPAR